MPRADNVARAARSGDKLRTLENLRDVIAKEINDGVLARDLASLSRRLVDIMDEIDQLKREEAESQRSSIVRRGPVAL